MAEAGAPYRQLWEPVAGHLAVAALSATAVLVAAALALRGRASAGASAVAVGVLAVASLVAAHRTLHPSAPAALIASRSPILQVLRPGLGTRVLTYDYGAVPGSGERYLGRRVAHLVETLPGAGPTGKAWPTASSSTSRLPWGPGTGSSGASTWTSGASTPGSWSS